jgi:L-methionine (R)-S-oxide reductase
MINRKFAFMSDKKSSRYTRLEKQIAELFRKNQDIDARMATINAVLYHKMDGFFWVGFYLLKEDRLIVGPYQGPLACMELEKDKGVCWTGIRQDQTIVVDDVHRFPGHIACDSRSKSEIVVPVKNHENKLIGVLDIDSNLLSNFDNTDVLHLENIVKKLFV